jgi:GT2 family glycosyltransferase
MFSGYVLDANDPGRKLAVEILVDGYPIRLVQANSPVPELMTEGVGDGCYGFSCSLGDLITADGAVVEARLANLGISVGAPIALSGPSGEAAGAPEPGSLRWLGGLRFSGWLPGRERIASGIVLVDGAPIMRVQALTWTHAGTSDGGGRPVRSFNFHLPEKFSDGAVHKVLITDDSGENIGGEPIFFVAYPDGLRDFIVGRGGSEQERLRAELFDRLLPMSVPFSDYQAWQQRFSIQSETATTLRGAIIMIGTGAVDDTLATLQAQTHSDWVAAALPAISGPTGLRIDLVRTFLQNDAANSDFVIFALAGTLFAPSAVQRMEEAFVQFPNARAVYCDVDIQGSDGAVWPLGFAAFDYERMLEQGYCAHVFALRRDAVERLGAGTSTLYRVFNSILDDGAIPQSGIVHVPGTVATLPEFDRKAASAELATASAAHLKSKAIAAKVTASTGGIFPAAHVVRKHDRPRTTIIIPTRNRRQLLQECIDSILPAIKRTSAELLIVDNDSADEETLDYLAEIESGVATVLRVPGGFNFPRLNNRAAKVARGEVLCLLNNDVKARDDCWLDEMLSRLAASDVGAVGALLVWPSGIVQHGGVALGPSFSATHCFNDRIDGDAGYGDLLRVAHECSAVTAACLVTRRRDYLDAGGMDEIRFPVNFNDVDYCLKLRAEGKRIVFTPHAKLVHLESASRGSAIKTNHQGRFERELANLRAKWGNVVAADPYYSPILSLDPIPFSALAWPARGMEPRINDPPVPAQIPPGF